ncbi:family 43 glycosylhydrolase [Hyalangium rubrum]|uniref:Family 43 glycosylhydrolase n=1 Tax=Hyalangium rubrum TaxID=3103134 RepID=A0ABU5HCP7_9BACT|nr:family 43 glycosylhydrolase [Hyalangium sp. s54d21]MDY7231016.1 family 43 glycosylhydrolase [Hyalangium sp. s54d21]
MRSRGVFLSAALFSLTVLAALSAPSCSSDELAPRPVPPTPEQPTPPPPPLQVVNPILPGDFADPSVIRVGNEYWASATSSEWAPQYPLLKSTDLLNWELVGHIFQNPPEWSEANYWAPELAVDNGRYFVFYTAKKRGGPLCIAVATASQPQGPYTDHGPLVCQELGSIDGALIRDENDKLFLVWKEDGNSRGLPTPFWAQPLSEDGTRLEGEKTSILINDVPWEGQLIEGPHFIKRNGWFYMFYAGAGCCGRACNYGVGVARSKNLLHGWEKHPLNPIMKNNETWKCPGHGSVVTDPQGRDYFLYHAYSTKDSVYVGRQGVLDPVVWGEDGWPAINQRRGVGGQLMPKAPALVDEFSAATLALGWVWPNWRKPTFSVADGMLTLAPPADRAEDVIGGVLARATRSGDYTAETILDLSGIATGTVAGLSAYGDPENALGIALKAGKLEVWRRQGNNHQVVTTVDAPEAPDKKLHLRMVGKSGYLFRFAVSSNGTDWTNVGDEVNGEYLPPWDRGIRVALTSGGIAGASARFDSLRITPE